MSKKLSLLAASIALVLSGCGSDDSNSSTTPATPVTGKFIDNVVEGMYYTTTSGKSGLTGSEGNYEAMSGDTITFYIGGENGLKVGAGSVRDVLTPFEAAGKYERAVNLAILLQSLDSVKNDNVLTIPDELRKPSLETLKAMAALSLDNRGSVKDFITEIAGASSIVSEAEAIEHMNDSFGEMVRGGEGSNPLMKPGSFVRQIRVTQNATELNGDKVTYIHADTMMEKTLFNTTRGMSEVTLRIEPENKITMLAGSNDATINSDKNKLYLTCLKNENTWTTVEDETGCYNGTTPVNELDEHFTLGNAYDYLLPDPDTEMTIDGEAESADVFMPFRAKTIAELNHYTADRPRNDGSETEQKWKRETMSGSYDPVTGIYTEIMKDTALSGTDCDTSSSCTPADSTKEKVFYSYIVDEVSAERYVDFAGTWETRALCENGEHAVMTTVFDQDKQISNGQECGKERGESISYPGNLEDAGTPYPYTDPSDMWWFGQEIRPSKATLTELNSVVRFCDIEADEQGSGYEPGAGDSCVLNGESKVYYVKWEYQPAGTNWDQGLLIRQKINQAGEVEDFSIMQKVK